MGRQQYLERLALGRSPFEQPDFEEPTESRNDSGQSNQAAPENEQQQYDSKGRPINPLTEERNAALRNAQNAVLSLVGVVESRQDSDRRNGTKWHHIRERHEQMLNAEEEHGDELSLAVKFLNGILTWLPEAVIARVQAGLYATSLSFADIVSRELGALRHGGVRGTVSALLPGMSALVTGGLLDALVTGVLVEALGRLEAKLLEFSARRTTRQWIHGVFATLTEIVSVVVGLGLLPLEYYGGAQRLGVAPAYPLLPPPRWLLPMNSSPLHHLIWTPSTRLGLLSSPGVLLTLRKFITRYQAEETPMACQFTSFEYPAINKPVDTMHIPTLRKDPYGRLLYQGYILRTRMLRWLGWELESVNERSKTPFENNRLIQHESFTSAKDEHFSSMEEDHNFYRSTSLSHLPVTFLAEHLDYYFSWLLILPLDSLVQRSVVQSYLAPTLPHTKLAMLAMYSSYSLFGGGPLGMLRASGFSTSAWGAVGHYVNRLALSLALYSSTKVGVFFVIYTLCRRQGIRNFNWGHSITQLDEH